MSSQKVDLKLVQGSSLTHNFDSLGKDLTGYTVQSHLRSNPRSETILLDMSSKISMDATGVLTLELDPSDTEDISGLRVYDIKLVDGNGYVTFPFWGYIEIIPAVTRA